MLQGERGSAARCTPPPYWPHASNLCRARLAREHMPQPASEGWCPHPTGGPSVRLPLRPAGVTHLQAQPCQPTTDASEARRRLPCSRTPEAL